MSESHCNCSYSCRHTSKHSFSSFIRCQFHLRSLDQPVYGFNMCSSLLLSSSSDRAERADCAEWRFPTSTEFRLLSCSVTVCNIVNPLTGNLVSTSAQTSSSLLLRTRASSDCFFPSLASASTTVPSPLLPGLLMLPNGNSTTTTSPRSDESSEPTSRSASSTSLSAAKSLLLAKNCGNSIFASGLSVGKHPHTIPKFPSTLTMTQSMAAFQYGSSEAK